MKYLNNITEYMGNTPLVKLNKLTEGVNATVFAKLECFNPSFSVKDRAAKAMIERAEREGLVNSDTVFVEPTSGNTGIGLAQICAIKGYKLILTMPETMSKERRRLLSTFGAELVLTPAKEGMKGSIQTAQSMLEKNDNYILLQQFSNPANPEIHYETTAKEIWNDTNGSVDIFVAGIGTSGTIVGTGSKLKEKKPEVKIIGVEPAKSPKITQDKSGSHGIQGIGAGFIPEIFKRELIDEMITVEDEDAFFISRRLAKEEGILAGISSGAAVHAALSIAKREDSKDKTIVVILPDSGERYLSTTLYDEEL